MIGLLPLVDLSVNAARGDGSSGTYCWVAYISVASVGLLFALDFHFIPACFVETSRSSSSSSPSALFLLVICGCCRWFSIGGSPSSSSDSPASAAADATSGHHHVHNTIAGNGAGVFDVNDEDDDEDLEEDEDEDDERGRYGQPRLFETDDSLDSGRKRYFGKMAKKKKKKHPGTAGNNRLGSPLLAGAEDGGEEDA